MKHNCQNATAKLPVAVAIVAVVCALFAAGTLTAQTRYAYMPSAATNDFRFLSITGAGIQTLGDQTLLFKIAAPANTATFELGVFDGNTGGAWDQGTQELEFTLFADPEGDATGTFQVGQWAGNSMADNAWQNFTVNNVSQARGTSNDFFYLLRVRAASYSAMFWSSFKLRVSGSIGALRLTNIAYTAPMGTQQDAQLIYPNYPALTPTVYDGTWNFFVDVPTQLGSISFWDGDLDRGSFDCSDNDVDDQDTPNGIPPFASGAAVVAEGVASVGVVACQDASGNPTTGMTTSNPPDDSRSSVFRRGPGIAYDVITPNGTIFTNNNPSGNLEWEQFRLDTAAFDRATMDYRADALPAGIYRLRIQGVDLSNLNAIRAPFEILGVDSVGEPIPLLRPYFITGTIFNDLNNNGTQDAGEPGMGGIDVVLNNSIAVTTDSLGRYEFRNLEPMTHTVLVDTANVPDDFDATSDFDGIGNGSANKARVDLNPNRRNATMNFGYTKPGGSPGGGTDSCAAKRTASWWYSNQDKWPVSSLVLGNRTYTKAELVAIMQKARCTNDKTYTLAVELIAAKLNRAMGNQGTVLATYVSQADAWLIRYPVGSNVRSSTRCNSPWREGQWITNNLKNQNLCVPRTGGCMR